MQLKSPDTPMAVLRYTLYIFLSILLATAIYVFVILQDGLPTLEQLENPRQDLATQVYSADGELLDHFATTRRTYAPYDSIPAAFVNALIATEDRAFRDHWGVHSFRILKAALKNVFAMRTKEGASTITQQLARNLYFTQEQTLARKIREAWTALQIERTYTKNEIIEMYANTVYYGKGAYGIRVASQVYFNKEPMKLSVAECAYLVGLFKAPEKYNNDDSAGIGRRNLILGMMHEEGFINEVGWSKATQEVLTKPSKQEVVRGIAPHFVELIRQALSKNGDWNDKLKGHDLYRDGLVIYTTLNARVQKHVLRAVEEHMADFQSQFDRTWSWKSRSLLLDELVNRAITKRPDYISASKDIRAQISSRLRADRRFVDSVKRISTVIQIGTAVIDPHTGAVLAMVGASPLGMKLHTASRYSLNHVTQIRRQPGSAFKPFVYAAALEEGLTPETTVESGPFSMVLSSGDVWNPSGSSKDGLPMSLRTALKYSTNSVAARLITEHTSPEAVIALCKRMGINGAMQAVPSIALGSVEVSPMELITSFVPFVNQGVSVIPSYITRIEDYQCR
jgi:penicillin-binding protein 1A